MANFVYDSTDRLHARGRERVKNRKNFAYELNGCPLIKVNCRKFSNEASTNFICRGLQTFLVADPVSFTYYGIIS